MTSIYLMHPISLAQPESVFRYFEETTVLLRNAVPWVRVLSPLVGKACLRTEAEFRAHGYDGHPLTTNHHIIERDRWMVAQADVVYANLVGTERASLGCAMELAWAYDQPGTYAVVAMDSENVHRHAFVLEASDAVFESHDEAMSYLVDFLTEAG